jgi:hypothetical protein
LAATAISRAIFVKMAPFLASVAAFLCLIVDHFECPDMALSLSQQNPSNSADPDANVTALADLPDIAVGRHVSG